MAMNTAVQYAITREQFQQPIANFGAIQYKMAEMAIRIFAAESALYRTARMIDDKEKALQGEGKHDNETLLGAAEEYAIECAMLKVLGSECLDYVVDEGVQIHGGNGFSDEYNISRAYRDSRINRIFEGTNEINRLLILDMYLKRALKGRINLMTPALAIQKELTSVPDFSTDDAPFAAELKYVANFKKAILMCAGAAVQKLMMQLSTQQELLMNLADMVIDTFQAESMLLRTMKMTDSKNALADLALDATRIFMADAADRINHNGKNAINSFAEGDEQRMMLMGLKRFSKTDNFNTQAARRRIATKIITNKGFIF
jgi:alkylation response protein AidB-like acyl-CoA dehydrogenase